jgi:hypothetical protein
MKLAPEKTALLTLDFQKGTLGLLPGAEAIDLARAINRPEFKLIPGGVFPLSQADSPSATACCADIVAR